MTVGRIVKVGEAVTRLKVDDRVYGYLPIRETHVVEEDRVQLVPCGLKDEEIVCIDPASVAFMSVREARFSLGDRVAVFVLASEDVYSVQKKAKETSQLRI